METLVVPEVLKDSVKIKTWRQVQKKESLRYKMIQVFNIFAVYCFIIHLAHASTHIFNIPHISNPYTVLTCTAGEDCFVGCYGASTFITPLIEVIGPTGYKLTIEVDSGIYGHNKQAYTFMPKITCTLC